MCRISPRTASLWRRAWYVSASVSELALERFCAAYLDLLVGGEEKPQHLCLVQ